MEEDTHHEQMDFIMDKAEHFCSLSLDDRTIELYERLEALDEKVKILMSDLEDAFKGNALAFNNLHAATQQAITQIMTEINYLKEDKPRLILP